MIFVIGGAFQGKLDYVCTKYHIDKTEVVEGDCTLVEELYFTKVWYGFHRFVRSFSMEKKEEILTILEAVWDKNPNIIIVSDEIGYGIVPMDAFEREYRELVGRLSCLLAKRAEAVFRVTCGLGTRIK